MLTVFCTWQPSKRRWRFREFVSIYNVKAMARRRKKYQQPVAFVKIPDWFLSLVEGRHKRKAKVAVKFYEYQHRMGLPIIK